MRLEWLEDILAVAESGSLSEAAERRNLTQSAFSRRIQSIEDAVGVTLFDRTKKPIQLRPNTADQSDRIAKLADDLRQLMTDLRRGDTRSGNRVIFASQYALTAAVTPELVRSIQDSAPEVFIRLRSANREDCLGLLLSRQADIALVYQIEGRAPPLEADFLNTLVLGRDALVPVFATDHMGRLSAEMDAGNLPYIGFPGDAFLGQVLDDIILPRIATSARAIPKAETVLTQAALDLSALGVGVAWVPRALAAAQIARGVLRDLSGSFPSCPLQVIALRIAGRTGPTENAIWHHLSTR